MLLKNMTIDERKKALRESAYKNEVRTYQKKLGEDEVNMRKTQYFQTDEKLENERETLKEVSKEFKERIAQFKEEKEHLAKSIRFKSESITSQCFDIVNFVNSVMETYNGEGDFIESRPLLPNERQGQMNFDGKLSVAV